MTHPHCIPFPQPAAQGHAQSPAQSSAQVPVAVALLDLRPLADFSDADLDGFLYQSRMCPTRSRFMPGNAEWLTPRRDITVRVALETVRERLQQAAACAELVARLERDYIDEDTHSDDDEALIVAAAVRDNLREALGMLGVVEVGLQRAAQGGGSATSKDAEPVLRAEEPLGRYQVLALAA